MGCARGRLHGAPWKLRQGFRRGCVHMGWSAAMGALRCAVDPSCTGAGFISLATSAKMPKFFKTMMPAAAAEETIKDFYSNHSYGRPSKTLDQRRQGPDDEGPDRHGGLDAVSLLHAPTLKLVEGATTSSLVRRRR